MLQITEDTPPDMLAGAMDLTVHLPNGRPVKMAVERSTPMMDLLVQITTHHHLQLSGYTLQALDMAPSNDRSEKFLPFKPNTPIGALDTQHVKVIPKSRSFPVKNAAPGHQPFESTFRLKVHLPRNQLFVIRVSQSVQLTEIMKKLCEEKNLDPQKYEFRHPGNLDQVLDPKLSLSDYQITEIYLVAKGSGNLNQAFSSSDIMALRKEEERKQMHNKTGGGVFNLIFRRGKSSTGSGSLSSDNRSISPTQSDDSRSVTPPAIQQKITTPSRSKAESPEKPKPPQRKRRPAPKPPQQIASEELKVVEKASSNISETSSKKSEIAGLTISHSRNSSDSSGYHEASVLSDNNTSLPRRPKSTMILPEDGALQGSNLKNMAAHSKSTSSLGLAGRKKKSAAPPPPPTVPSESVTTSAATGTIPSDAEPPSPVVAVVASPQALESTNPKTPVIDHPPPPPVWTEEETAPIPEEPERKPKIEEYYYSEPAVEKEPELEDWQYQLPSPPKGFRDASPVPFPSNPNGSEAVDSVVTSPELFEKLKDISSKEKETLVEYQETISDATSTISEEDKPILNKLSLENLEKRKSLVYNRELATSLKMSLDSPENEGKRKTDDFSNSITKFEKTYDELRRSSLNNTGKSTSTLPNFKITTYDNPKKKINIFEDDTIRSSSNSTETSKRNSIADHAAKEDTNLVKSPVGKSMENLSFSRKNSGADEDFKKPITSADYKFYKPRAVRNFRSESFSSDQWTPMRPVARSKSQVALNMKPAKTEDLPEETLSKSNSLFDVSGLQSLGVMRLIQNKLNTPTSSVENLHQVVAPQQVAKEVKIEAEKPVKTSSYQYRSPSINMGTWSDRPKIPVNVKEDPDYKYSNANSKLIVSSIHNEVKSSNTVEVRSANFNNNFNSKSVSIKVNGASEHQIMSQNAGNVVIKIGGDSAAPRKPLGTVNKIDGPKPRPHSVAFGGDFETSRVPIVRSVEFKKPYKDFQNQTSVTHIFNNNTNGYHTNNKALETENSIKIQQNGDFPQKPVFRVNSFLQNSQPVVRGFQSGNKTAATTQHNVPATINNNNNRFSWGQPGGNFNHKNLSNSSAEKELTTNKSVPFSQLNLRRTESTKMQNGGGNQKVPPPAPLMPKLQPVARVEPASFNSLGDPKEQLLQAIRDFGGKKGLRTVKA